MTKMVTTTRLLLVIMVNIMHVTGNVDLEKLCAGCIIWQGVGYKPYTNCEQYVICVFTDYGFIDHSQSKIVACPFGEFWSEEFLVCKPAYLVDCKNDPCKKTNDAAWVQGTKSCRMFWTCSGHKTQKAECCEKFHKAFIVGPGNIGGGSPQCSEDPLCKAMCDEIIEPPTFDYCKENFPVHGKPNIYMRINQDGKWTMKCGLGEMYDPKSCYCVRDWNYVIPIEKCVKDLHLPFDDDHQDYSQNQFEVKEHNVPIYALADRKGKAAAFFDGKGRLSVIRYANTDFGSKFAIQMRLKELRSGSLPEDPQTVLSNGECDHAKTPIHVTIAKNGDISGTVRGLYGTAYVKVSTWDGPKDVTLAYDGNKVSLCAKHINSNISVKDTAHLSGNVPRSECGIIMGEARPNSTDKNFTGMMDEVLIYLCIPDDIQACINKP